MRITKHRNYGITRPAVSFLTCSCFSGKSSGSYWFPNIWVRSHSVQMSCHYLLRKGRENLKKERILLSDAINLNVTVYFTKWCSYLYMHVLYSKESSKNVDEMFNLDPVRVMWVNSPGSSRSRTPWFQCHDFPEYLFMSPHVASLTLNRGLISGKVLPSPHIKGRNFKIDPNPIIQSEIQRRGVFWRTQFRLRGWNGYRKIKPDKPVR